MRKFFRDGTGPLLFLSFILVGTLGSYILWKLALKSQKSGSSGEGLQIEKTAPISDIDSGGSDVPLPPNGAVLMKPEAACLIPLTVEVKDTDNNYYIFLKLIKPRENAVSADSPEPGKPESSDIGFFAAAASTVLLNVPAGMYSLTYAAGQNWHGLRERFGPSTKYYTASVTLAFFKDGTRLYGNTIQLLPPSDNDTSSRRIDPSDFPG